jgi:hypothetical protein
MASSPLLHRPLEPQQPPGLATARARIQAYVETFEPDGTRITEKHLVV